MQIEVNCHASPAGTTTTIYTQRIRNYTAKPIEVEVRRTLPRPRRLPQPAGAEAARLPDGAVHGDGRGRARRPTCSSRSSAAPGPQRQAEQRDAGRGGGEAMKRCHCRRSHRWHRVLALLPLPLRGRERRPVHRAARDTVQLTIYNARGPDAGPRDAHGDASRRGSTRCSSPGPIR